MSNQENFDALGDGLPQMDEANFLEALGSLMGGQEGEEGFEGDFDFAAMMQEMMKQFTSKEALYQPTVSMIPKYEEYLEANKATLSAEDLERYTQQYETYKELKRVFDEEEENQEATLELIQKLSALGDAPAEIAPEEPEGAEEQDAGAGCAPQ